MGALTLELHGPDDDGLFWMTSVDGWESPTHATREVADLFVELVKEAFGDVTVLDCTGGPD